MTVGAFFDLDGTLLTVNSGRLWFERERRLGRLSRWQSLRAIFYLVAYRFGFFAVEKVLREIIGTLKGQEEEPLRREVEAWYEEEVRPFAAPGAWPVLKQHRQQGHPLILLTSSSPYESAIACRHFHLDHILCARYSVEKGLFTGELDTPLCYGAGKVLFAEEFAREKEIDLQQSYFYSDSITDLPMLERVGFPRVVNPDPRLRRLARKRNWTTLDWHHPPT